MRQPFLIADARIEPGERRLIDIPVSRLSNHTPVTLPVHVLHGARPGPAMFLSAAIHGDELNGVEIIRRVLRTLAPGNISGTLLCVPVVNAYGFIGRSRYLPDRRDLNRSFPGSPNGSLAARLAHLFLKEVVKRSQIGIDLHTAATHRVNLPQIRCEFQKRPRTRELAIAFGTQVILDSPERPGSLRKAARDAGVDVLVYEGGEGLRFDEFAIKAGVDGIARVMLDIGMLELPEGIENVRPDPNLRPTLFANASKWVRAPEAGVLRLSEAHRRGRDARRSDWPRGEPLRGKRRRGSCAPARHHHRPNNAAHREHGRRAVSHRVVGGDREHQAHPAATERYGERADHG